MRINLIYLAAGNSRRFFINGKQENKLLYPFNGRPLYQYGLAELEKVSRDLKHCYLYVVTQYPEIYNYCKKMGNVTVVLSKESKKGISYSIRSALDCIGSGKQNDCYLFQAADQPFIRKETIIRFIMDFLHSGKKAGSVMYRKIPGNPCIFHQDYVQELYALEKEEGGRKILKQHPEDVFKFQLPEEKEKEDIDNFSDYEKNLKQSSLQSSLKIYVTGSGGKTSLIHYLAEKYSQNGKKVLILTTTHMLQEKGMILVEEDPVHIEERICRAFRSRNIVVAGCACGSKEKFTWIGKERYDQMKSYADVILFEADGSKHLPAKFPGEQEPVIQQDADMIYVVFGLSALGKQMKDACHRYDLAGFIAKETDMIGEMTAVRLLKEGYLQKLKRDYPKALILLVLNQADDPDLKQSAQTIAQQIGEDAWIVSLKKELEKISNHIEKNENYVI